MSREEPVTELECGRRIVPLSEEGSLEIARTPERIVVSLVGEVDLATADEVLDAIHPLIDPDGPGIEVDLGRLEFIDSTGINKLILAQQAAVEAGVPLVLRNARPSTRRVFVIAGLVSYLHVE